MDTGRIIAINMEEQQIGTERKIAINTKKLKNAINMEEGHVGTERRIPKKDLIAGGATPLTIDQNKIANLMYGP